MDVSPSIVLATWAAGVGGVSALVVGWRIVGVGFTRLVAAITIGIGVPAALASPTPWAWAGCGFAAVGLVAARRWAAASASLGAAAACLAAAALTSSGGLAVFSGMAALGGVTGEMVLGHWYLVDPTLPRKALRVLGLVGGAGVILDVAVLALLGAVPWVGSDAVVGWGFVLLAVTTLVLMVAVWFSLAEPGYAGVMAATGLSYLAVLTVIGTAVLGRMLAT